MKVSGRKRRQFGPIVVNLASSGFLRWRVSSWGFRLWRVGWNSRTRQWRFDLPGPFGATTERGRRR